MIDCLNIFVITAEYIFATNILFSDLFQTLPMLNKFQIVPHNTHNIFREPVQILTNVCFRSSDVSFVRTRIHCKHSLNSFVSN